MFKRAMCGFHYETNKMLLPHSPQKHNIVKKTVQGKTGQKGTICQDELSVQANDLLQTTIEVQHLGML